MRSGGPKLWVVKQYPVAISSILLGVILLLLVAWMPSWAGISAKEPSQASLELQYQRWEENFKAADPNYQAFCEGALRSFKGSGEFQQDLYVFFNIFKYWPMTGKKGFYVDSGTNEPLDMSNSLFYDKCLGWNGICVEPQSQYHEKILETRSCHLFKGCLASVSMNATMEGEGGTAKVVANTGDSATGTTSSVQCSRLKDVLASQGQSRIDFWSLDVEGAELDVLGNFDFDDVPVHALLIEEFWVSTRDLDYLMTSKGFIKLKQLNVDAVYLARTAPFIDPSWEPPHLVGHWQFSKQYRETKYEEAKTKWWPFCKRMSVLLCILAQVADRMKAGDLKERGNAAFAAGKHQDAAELFSQCIAIDPGNEV